MSQLIIVKIRSNVIEKTILHDIRHNENYLNIERFSITNINARFDELLLFFKFF